MGEFLANNWVGLAALVVSISGFILAFLKFPMEQKAERARIDLTDSQARMARAELADKLSETAMQWITYMETKVDELEDNQDKLEKKIGELIEKQTKLESYIRKLHGQIRSLGGNPIPMPDDIQEK